MALVQNKLLFV